MAKKIPAAVTAPISDPPIEIASAKTRPAGPTFSAPILPATAKADPAPKSPLDPPNVAPKAIRRTAGLTPLSDPPKRDASASPEPAGPTSYADVIFLADILEDLMKVRIANENRLRSLTSTENWGKGISAPNFVQGLVDGITVLEHQTELALMRAVHQSPLGAWVKATPGVGAKGVGRLLKEIGDPAWNFKYGRPRTLRELYAYCGLHVWPAQGILESHAPSGGPDSTDPRLATASHAHRGVGVLGGDAHLELDSHRTHGVAPSRTRGVQSNWSTAAKTRLYTTAEACMKHRTSKYRPVYDEGRAKYADAVHQVECRRCGPSGKPALAGTPLSLGHQHARALRLVMKAILKDLWQAARDVHFEADSQGRGGVAGLSEQAS